MVKRVGIYWITNTTNNRVYIGASTDIDRRFYNHKRTLRRSIHDNPELQDDYGKYGARCFKYSMVEYCSEEKLAERESYWIDHFGGIESDTTYNFVNNGQKNRAMREKLSNSLSGANNPFYGKAQTEESNQKRREALLGRQFTDDHRQRISDAMKGERNHSYGKRGEESPNYGKPLTAERRRKISESLKKRNKERGEQDCQEADRLNARA